MAQVRDTELDVGTLARALWRRAWLLLLLGILAAGGTYWALGYVQPLYMADTSILIEERESPLTRPSGEVVDTTADFDESAIQSQVEVLRSREIADAVIDKLDLTRRPEFDPATRPSPIDSLKVLLGVDRHPVDSSIRQRVMNNYFERLTVYPLQKSRVIAVEFQAPSPTLAADGANAVAEAFVDLQQDAKRESAVAATDWLAQEIATLRERVADAEQAVTDYRTSNDLFNSDEAGNLDTQQLGDLNAELARARAARAEAEARAELVQELLAEGASIDASQEVLASPLIQRLQERQVALQSQIADLSATLLPAHPRIRALQEQLANLDSQILQETRKIQASLSTAARVAAARERSLLESLDEAKVDVSRSDEQEIELRALEREAAGQRGLLESLLLRYREAVARTDANYLPADARIISRAVAPASPSYPKKTMMAVAAALATLLIVSAILLMRELASGRAFRVVGYDVVGPDRWSAPASTALVPVAYSVAPQRFGAAVPPEVTPEAAEISPAEEPVIPVSAADEATSSPPAGAGPENAPGSHTDGETVAAPLSDTVATVAPVSHAVAATAANPQAAEDADDAPAVADAPREDIAERPGAAELAEILIGEGVRVAVFVGANGGEGAGEIAFAAARLAAQRNVRPVIIDLGRIPSTALGGYEQPGLGNLLRGDAAFGEVINRDEVARVHFIPMGAIDANTPLQRMQIVIGALTHTYDKLIVVANTMEDWPTDIRPELAAIVCGPDITEEQRTESYDAALARGAANALIVRFEGDRGGAPAHTESEAA